MTAPAMTAAGAPDGSAERQPDDVTSPWWGEHVARYRFARQFMRPGQRVLDVACGSGYGLSVHAEAGADVVGVDVSTEATGMSRRRLGDQGLVVRADGCRLPFASRSFGLITSFETIEHLVERDRFVAELARVLAPGGVCLMSTPNARHTRPIDGRPRNPHHVHEYEPGELQAELDAHFGRVDLAGQVLDGRFRIPPFWDDQQRLPRTPGVQARLLTRRVVYRLPGKARELISRKVWGHSFFPSEGDYHFDLGGVDTAPVLLAICRPALERAAP